MEFKINLLELLGQYELVIRPEHNIQKRVNFVAKDGAIHGKGMNINEALNDLIENTILSK